MDFFIGLSIVYHNNIKKHTIIKKNNRNKNIKKKNGIHLLKNKRAKRAELIQQYNNTITRI